MKNSGLAEPDFNFTEFTNESAGLTFSIKYGHILSTHKVSLFYISLGGTYVSFVNNSLLLHYVFMIPLCRLNHV